MMRNIKSTLTALLLVGAMAFAHADNNAYKIKVQVKGLKDTICFLGGYFGDQEYIQDTTKVDANGMGVFTGTKKLPGGVYFILMPNKKKYFEFLIPNDKAQEFSMATDTTDFVKNMKIKGSPENKLFYDYLNYITQKENKIVPLQKDLKRVKGNKDSTKIVQKKIDAINKQVADYKDKVIKEHPKTFVAVLFKAMKDPKVPKAPKLPNGKKDSLFAYHYYKAHFFDNIDFSDGRLVRTPFFAKKVKQYLDQLTVQTPDSINAAADYLSTKAEANKDVFKFIVHYVTHHYETSNIMGMDAVFVHMVDKYYATGQAFWVDSTQLYRITQRAKTLTPILIGKKAPNLIMPDTSGKIIVLDSIKAKYTILYFWDYDCGYCQKATPKLVKWYDEAKKSMDIKVYAVQTNDDIKKWENYVNKHGLHFINVSDRYNMTHFHTIYDIYSTPVVYVLDASKHIIAKRLDVTQIGDFLKKHEKMEKAKKK